MGKAGWASTCIFLVCLGGRGVVDTIQVLIGT